MRITGHWEKAAETLHRLGYMKEWFYCGPGQLGGYGWEGFCRLSDYMIAPENAMLSGTTPVITEVAERLYNIGRTREWFTKPNAPWHELPRSKRNKFTGIAKRMLMQ